MNFLWDGLILGITMALMGTMIAVKGDFYSGKYHRIIEFGGYNVPIGIFMAIVGVALISTSFKKNE